MKSVVAINLCVFVCAFIAGCLTRAGIAQDSQTQSEAVKLAPPAASANDSALSEEERLEQALNDVIDHVHAQQFVDDPFPSAKKCAQCHPQHYREWSVSPHSYAQLSPVFLTMSNKLQAATSGTMGDFCIRCHTPVGISLGESTSGTNLDRHPTSREGVTCVVCHRVNQAYGKGAGRLSLMKGNLSAPVTGPRGNDILMEVLSDQKRYGALKTDYAATEQALEPHGDSQRFFEMGTSGFCGTCHDVFAPNGFRLEDAFSEFKHSPSAQIDGHNCQDCHMGSVPGKAEGYDVGPAAIVNGKETPHRRITNHIMVGPDYSILHRGLFPHHLTAIREEGASEDSGMATMREWLQFDDRGGWGTHEFESRVSKDDVFPSPWDTETKRRKARLILDEQGNLLKEATMQRLQVMQAGFGIDEIRVSNASRGGLHFDVPVRNLTRGHGVPTGFDAERVIFLRTFVINAANQVVFISGDLDPNGDVRDKHSLYVHNGKVPRDPQLFTLQTRFVVRNLRGGEREQILPVPYTLDPLPFIRPETRPFTVLGRPMAARKHKQNLEPGGVRVASYDVPSRQLHGPGPFTIRVQLILGMVPPNLIHEIGDVGFDYGLSAREVCDRIVEGHLVIRDKAVQVDID